MQKLNTFIKRNVLGEKTKPDSKKSDMKKYAQMFESSPSYVNGENPFINNLTYVVPTIDLPSDVKFDQKFFTDRKVDYKVIPLKSDERKVNRKASAYFNPISFINSQLAHNKRQRNKILRVVDGNRDYAYSELASKYYNEKNTRNIKIYQKKSDSSGRGILTNQMYDEIEEEKATKEKVFKFHWDKDTEIKWKPEIREGGTMISINNLIYMYGGISRSILNEVTALDFKSMQWRKIKTYGDIPPWGRTGHSMTKWKKGFIIFGGEKDFNQILRIRDCFSDAKYFSPQKSEWTTLRVTGEILEARRNHAACMVGKFMIVSGGMNNHGKILSDFYSLSMESLKWDELDIITEDKKPFNICFHTMASIFRGEPKVYALYNPFDFVKEKKFNKVKEEGLYIFGGRTNNILNGNLAVLKIGMRPLKLEYPETKGIPPSGRYQHCMHHYKAYNILIIYGGRVDGDFEDPLDALQPNIHVLSLDNMNWCSVSTFGLTQTHKCAFASTIFDSKLVVFGGVNFHKYIEQEVFFLELDQSRTRVMALRSDYNVNKDDDDDHKESSIFSDINNSRNKLPLLNIKTEPFTPKKSIQSFVPIPTKYELRRNSTRMSSALNIQPFNGKTSRRTSSKYIDTSNTSGGFLSNRKDTK